MILSFSLKRSMISLIRWIYIQTSGNLRLMLIIQRWLFFEMVVKSNIMKYVSLMMLHLILLMYLLTLVLILNSMVFDCTQNSITTKFRKFTFNLCKEVNDNNLNVATTLSLFDTYVSSVLHYACKVWGFHKAPHVQNFWNESCSLENQQKM